MIRYIYTYGSISYHADILTGLAIEMKLGGYIDLHIEMTSAY